MQKMQISPSRFTLTTPVVLLSTWGRERRPNIITLAWTGVLCSEPPIVYASVRPSRHSYAMLKENGDFVLNVPAAQQVLQVDQCGVVSGRDEDKFALCGFTAEPAERVDAPLIAQCPAHLECRTRQVLELGVHHAFVAEVLGLLVGEDLLSGGDSLAEGAFEPLVYASGSRTYHRGAPIASYGYSKNR